jgi:hypothetical protein
MIKKVILGFRIRLLLFRTLRKKNCIYFTSALANRLSWHFRPAFLQSWGSPGGTLFAGPWIGEFGWELMNWQAFLRHLRPRYERMIVSCPRGNEALYEDFCDEFVPHDIAGTANCHMAFRLQDRGELRRVLALVPPDADFLQPRRHVPSAHQTFIRYGQPDPSLARDVLVHARGKPSSTGRNWSGEHWERLIDGLRRDGLSVGFIGRRGATLDLDLGEENDFRDLPLAKTLDLLASARLVAGPSSGPLHLASLCSTPHLVWTDRATYSMGITSREKYESWWNPLKTEVVVIDSHGFNPSPQIVAGAVRRFFSEH